MLFNGIRVCECVDVSVCVGVGGCGGRGAGDVEFCIFICL